MKSYLVKRLRSVMPNSSIILFATDAKGAFTVSERKGLELPDLRPEQIAGQSVYELYADSPAMIACVNEAMRGVETVADVEAKGRHYTLCCSPTRGDDGRVNGVMSVGIDITNRVKTEREPQESAERVRLLLDSTAEAICGMDKDFNCVFANASCLRILGVEEDELVGCDVDELLHFTHNRLAAGKVLAELWEIFSTKGGAHFEEVTLRRKSGAQFPAEMWLYPIRRDEQIIGSVMTFLDNTQKKALSENLKTTMVDLARSNKELEQFAYVASHDLQEPLRVIAGYLQLLRNRYNDKLDKEADRFISKAVDASLRMSELVNDLLQYSRVGTKGNPLQAIGMDEILERALDHLRTAIAGAGATVAKDRLPTVMADPVQMTRLLQNLIGNALKFHKKDTPPSIHVGVERNKGDWVFSVRDNGIGIAQEHYERIFVIFQRLHTRQEYPGTGIGLSICQKIVERHGGRIWCESTPGEGTTFFFTIPAMPEAS